jgi:hypothetical protein
MLDSKFWKNYFEVYDVLDLLIHYREGEENFSI